jgi:hypothetical protein
MMTDHASAENAVKGESLYTEISNFAKDMPKSQASANIDAIVSRHVPLTDVSRVKVFLFDNAFRLHEQKGNSFSAFHNTHSNYDKNGRDVIVNIAHENGVARAVSGSVSRPFRKKDPLYDESRVMMVDIVRFLKEDTTHGTQLIITPLVVKYLPPGMDVTAAKILLFDNGFDGHSDEKSFSASYMQEWSFTDFLFGNLSIGNYRILIMCETDGNKIKSVFAKINYRGL